MLERSSRSCTTNHPLFTKITSYSKTFPIKRAFGGTVVVIAAWLLETMSSTVGHCSQQILLHCRSLFAVDCIDTVSCTSTLYCLTMHLTLVELFISTSKNYSMVTKTRGCGSIDEAPGTYATYSYWGLGVTDAHNYLLVQCVNVQFTIAYEQLRLMALWLMAHKFISNCKLNTDTL